MGEEQRKSQTEHTLLWFIAYEGAMFVWLKI
uniref:Uncharacterized protein n=1 Tax=Myoviridae sp. ctKhy9 TaxID=2827677 RepID=A0A8S5SKI4_9CAUD|nr:MAG TPA: hypothetical protein [Myoviridae sp. ctKhy9]